MSDTFAKVSSEHPLLQLAEPANASRRIVVMGLGFVGLPLALSFAMRGCQVVGLDISAPRVEALQRGEAHDAESYRHYDLVEILNLQMAAGRFRATTNAAEALDWATDVIITVGIPTANGIPILDHLTAACRTLAKHLRPGMTVVLRSTMIPGTTERVLKPILEESGLRAGEDFYLAYASERIAEGHAFEEFENMPLIMAGVNSASARAARELLAIVTKAEIFVASRIAHVEAAKVIENVQRDVNIAMVQQFARLFEAMELDTYEIIRLANTHRRVNLLVPGPGVGGFCIPNATYYLLPVATELGVNLDLLTLARLINDGVPDVVVSLVEKKLHQAGVALTGAKIAALGLAMKDYSSDDRITPATVIVEKLKQRGAIVSAFDPLVVTPYDYKVGSLEECLRGADCVLILARQKGAEFADIVPFISTLSHRVLVDTKGAISPALAQEYGFELGQL